MNEKPTVVMNEKGIAANDAPANHDIEHLAPVNSRSSRGDSKEPGHVNIQGVDEAEIDNAEAVIHDEAEFTEAEYKKLRRKFDFVLMPILMILYGLQYTDKTSLSSGAVFGLFEETHLKGNEFGNLSTFFYMAYAIAQLPMGWVLQRFPIGKALSVCVILWGGMVLLLAACHNYAQLAAVRTFLGWFESVVTPGFAFITASWYLRSEQTQRQGFYLAMNTFFSIVFGAIIYFLAKNAQEHGGLAGWRVINLFLGGLTVGMGIISLIFVGTPDEVWWLSKREKRMANARVVSNGTGGGEQHPWKWEQVRECFRDPQFYMGILFNFLVCVPNGALTTFNNLIMKGLGFDALGTVLYSMPSGAVGFVCVLSLTTLVRYRPHLRFPVAIVCILIVVFVLFFVSLAPVSNWAKYGVYMLWPVATVGTFLVWPLMSINIAGRTKKSFLAGMSLLAYSIGNIVGSQIMRPSDAPKYLKGISGCAVCFAVACVDLALWWWYYVRTNKRRDREFEESGMSDEVREHEMRLAGKMDLTDLQNRHFRYLC